MDDIARLEHMAHQLEQDGDDMKAVRLMEKAVSLRGEGSNPETLHAAERLIVKYNTVAVRSFKSDDYETATALLTNAQALTEPARTVFETSPETRLRLRGTTYNNLGCMERRRGRLELAAKYLRLSLEHDGNQSAVTYLNLAAIYTQMRRAEEAVACSRRAIGLLSAPGNATASQNPGLTAVAHHNLAMALESLDPDACLSAYETALNVARSGLGPTSPTTISIKRNYERFAARVGTARRTAAAAEAMAPPSQTFLPPLQTRATKGSTHGGASPSHSARGQSSHGHHQANTPRVGAMVRKAGTPRAGPSGAHQAQEASARRTRMSTAPGTARGLASSSTATGVRKSRAASTRRSTKEASAKPAKAFGRDSDSEMTGADSDREPTPPPLNRRSSSVKVASPVSKGPQPPTAPRPPQTSRDEGRAGGASVGGRLRQLDPEEERRKDDVVAFMVSRLGALLRAEEEFELRYAAAVKIQCLSRGIAARDAAERKRTQRQQSVQFQELRERKAAAGLIEFFRMLVERRNAALAAEAEAQAAAHTRDNAAIKIQSIARRWLAKQLVKRLRGYYKDYTKALRRLQCWFRLELAKARVHKMRLVARDAAAKKLRMEREHFAATQIQRSFRAFRALKATATRKSTLRAARERDRDSNRTHSSKRLQAFWRGLLGAKVARVAAAAHSEVIALRERNELREDAAVRIQGVARGWMDRRRAVDVMEVVRAHRAKAAERRRISAAVRIQSLVRRVAASQRTRDMAYERRIGKIMRRQEFAAAPITAFVQALPALFRFAALLEQKFPPATATPTPPPAEEAESSSSTGSSPPRVPPSHDGFDDEDNDAPAGEVIATDLSDGAMANDPRAVSGYIDGRPETSQTPRGADPSSQQRLAALLASASREFAHDDFAQGTPDSDDHDVNTSATTTSSDGIRPPAEPFDDDEGAAAADVPTHITDLTPLASHAKKTRDQRAAALAAAADAPEEGLERPGTAPGGSRVDVTDPSLAFATSAERPGSRPGGMRPNRSSQMLEQMMISAELQNLQQSGGNAAGTSSSSSSNATAPGAADGIRRNKPAPFDADDLMAASAGDTDGVVLTDLTPVSKAARGIRSGDDEVNGSRPGSRQGGIRDGSLRASSDAAIAAYAATPTRAGPRPGASGLPPLAQSASTSHPVPAPPSAHSSRVQTPVNDALDVETDDDDSEPYVVPPRVPTPPRLKLSVAYLEEKRKRELQERQRKRLAEYDPALRPAHEIEQAAYEADRDQRRAAEAAAKSKVLNAAAVRLQGFFRGVYDRAMFREKRAVIADYLDALEEAHRAPPHQPRPPPALGNKSAAPAPRPPQGRPPAGGAAPRKTSDDFGVLEAVSTKMGPKVAQQRSVAAATKVQAALRTRASGLVRDARGARTPAIHAAATKLTTFGRGVASKARTATRSAAAKEAEASRVAAEAEHDRRLEAAGAVVAAWLPMPTVRSACLDKIRARVEQADQASRKLAGLSRISSSKAETQRRRDTLAQAAADRVETELAMQITPETSPSKASDGSASPSPAVATTVLSADEAGARIVRVARGRLGRRQTGLLARNVAAQNDARIAKEASTAAEEESAKAATTIQCAARKRAARNEVANRREAREAAWEARAARAAEENEADSSLAEKFRTPDKTSQGGGSPAAAGTPDVEAGVSDNRAAGVIQRGFRVHAAKQEADRRRAAAAEQLAAKRKQLELEEADMSF